MRGFVLVGGWPGSGKSTLSSALAAELGIPHLSKDLVKESLMDAMGAPPDVEASRRLGRVRDQRHLDGLRDEEELWAEEVAPLGLGPLLEVDTSDAVDVAEVAAVVRSMLG